MNHPYFHEFANLAYRKSKGKSTVECGISFDNVDVLGLIDDVIDIPILRNEGIKEEEFDQRFKHYFEEWSKGKFPEIHIHNENVVKPEIIVENTNHQEVQEETSPIQPQLKNILEEPPHIPPVKKLYDFHWVKSLGKAALITIPVAIILNFLKRAEIFSLPNLWEGVIITFCLAALFFINQDPKYKFYRAAMWCLAGIGIVNVLPLIDSQFHWTESYENGEMDFLFKLGIQDNWYISVVLGVVTLYLLYRQKD
ncbi:hypothetical protein [Haliscomenobacter hydrossis]|uniref:hypothetical protein n=1 Tax=Haliscomenobacter hydrossis TaxID=2350 RepID=UPI0005C6FA4B|nr:hypothetical protein [Haliscomenobacter hydrossis]